MCHVTAFVIILVAIPAIRPVFGADGLKR